MAAHHAPSPQDSPGKNTGVVCHFLLQGKNIKDKKRDKRGRDRALSWEGSLKNRGFQTPRNTLTAESVVSLGTTEGHITRRKNK